MDLHVSTMPSSSKPFGINFHLFLAGAKSLQAKSWIQFIENRCNHHQKEMDSTRPTIQKVFFVRLLLKQPTPCLTVISPSLPKNHPSTPKWLGLNVEASSKVSYHPSWSWSQKLTMEFVGWGQIFWVGDAPPKTKMDISHDGLEKVTPASNMAIFGIYVKFLGCIHNIHGTNGILTY